MSSTTSTSSSTDCSGEEYTRLMTKLREFNDEVAPVAKDIKEFIDNSYTKDLKKRKGMSTQASSTTFLIKPARGCLMVMASDL